MTLDASLLAIGSCLAGLGVLTATLLALLFRHPNAPRWTRPEFVALLACVPVTAMLGFGLGYTAYGLYRLLHGDGDPRELLVLAAVLIVLALLWRGLRVGQRLRGYALATGDGAPGGLSLPAAPTSGQEPAPPATRGPAPGLPGISA
jgi:hypothetical protein